MNERTNLLVGTGNSTSTFFHARYIWWSHYLLYC